MFKKAYTGIAPFSNEHCTKIKNQNTPSLDFALTRIDLRNTDGKEKPRRLINSQNTAVRTKLVGFQW